MSLMSKIFTVITELNLPRQHLQYVCLISHIGVALFFIARLRSQFPQTLELRFLSFFLSITIVNFYGLVMCSAFLSCNTGE